jgi:hypothetical protein
MYVVMTRAGVAGLSLVLVSTLGCSPASTVIVVRGEAMSGEGRCQAVDLDSIYEIDAHGGELVVKGAVFGWDPRPEKMVAADRRYGLPAGWLWRGQPGGDWVQASYGTLVHRPSGRRARLDGIPGDYGPIHVISMPVSQREQRLLIAAGDFKVGPHGAFWCHVTVRGELVPSAPTPRH